MPFLITPPQALNKGLLREAREIIQDIVGQMQIGRGDENLSARVTDEISLLSDEAIKIRGIPKPPDILLSLRLPIFVQVVFLLQKIYSKKE